MTKLHVIGRSNLVDSLILGCIKVFEIIRCKRNCLAVINVRQCRNKYQGLNPPLQKLYTTAPYKKTEDIMVTMYSFST